MLFLSSFLTLLLLPVLSLASPQSKLKPWAAPQPRAASRWLPREPSTFRPLAQRVPMKARASPVPVNWNRTVHVTGDFVVRYGTTNITEYATIQAAVDAVKNIKTETRIFVYEGVYYEQVFIKGSKGKVSIQGQTPDASDYTHNLVTISSGIVATSTSTTLNVSNDASGTFRASQAQLSLYNLNIENTYGHTAAGCQCQAIALSTQGADGEQGFYGLKVTGYQDTLLANKGTQIFAKSYISGAVDFIFGQYAPAYFWNSDILSTSKGAITAPGGAAADPTTADAGQLFVFDQSRILLAPNAATNATGNTFLGRPWKAFGKSVFLNSELGSHLAPAGWQIWSTATPNTDTSVLAEYNNYGLGSYANNAGSRASFAKQLTTAQALDYTIDKVLGSDYASWVDADYLT